MEKINDTEMKKEEIHDYDSCLNENLDIKEFDEDYAWSSLQEFEKILALDNPELKNKRQSFGEIFISL